MIASGAVCGVCTILNFNALSVPAKYLKLAVPSTPILTFPPNSPASEPEFPGICWL